MMKIGIDIMFALVLKKKKRKKNDESTLKLMVAEFGSL